MIISLLAFKIQIGNLAKLEVELLAIENEIERIKNIPIERPKTQILGVIDEKEYNNSIIDSKPLKTPFKQATEPYNQTDCPYIDLLKEKSWNINIACNVMKRESSFNRYAVNWNDFHRTSQCFGSFGLMQVGCLHTQYFENYEDLYQPKVNIDVAYKIYQKSGWRAWGVCLPTNNRPAKVDCF